MAGKPKYTVMLSSTGSDLVEHRRAIREAMLGQDFFPIAMENDSALPDHDLISASLEKVEEADGYIGVISYRYGQTPFDADRNPNQLSLTELEFRRAVDRPIPICMFIMADDHPVPRSAVSAANDEESAKLTAFTTLAKTGRIYAEFSSVDDLRAKVSQSLGKLRTAIEKRPASPVSDPPTTTPPAPTSPELPTGWDIVDRETLAKARANPPPLDDMVHFFDGILPTWRFALARGVQPRTITGRIVNRLRALHAGATKPQIVLLTGAGGEGKSTAVLHAAAALVEDAGHSWTCFHRRASNSELPEDTLANLPVKPNHAWLVAIDDADNIAHSILAAVKKVAARTDVHLLLAARDAEWQMKRLVPGSWQPAADFHNEPLAGLDEEDARRIVSSWVAWGDDAMGNLKGRSEDEAITALLGHAREFATDQQGELLGALLVTRQGEDMRAHVRTLVNGLSTTPVIKNVSLRDLYAMVAAMHAENQLYLSRPVLAHAIGCDVDELERKALWPLRREAMLDGGDTFVLTRHRRIAEAACAALREDDEKFDQWYPLLARSALRARAARSGTVPSMNAWNAGLANHFVKKGQRWWPIAVAIAQAVYNAEPTNPHLLTCYGSVLRRTKRPTEALVVLKATGQRYRNDRAVLYEWSTVAGAADNHPLAAWLGGRTLADGGEQIDANRAKLSLAGLGVAFRELFATSQNKAFVAGEAACGHLGLELEGVDATARGYFQRYIADGRRHGITELSCEQAIEAIRKAVILGANELEPDSDPVYFENLLSEPEGYRYAALQRMVAPAKPTRRK